MENNQKVARLDVTTGLYVRIYASVCTTSSFVSKLPNGRLETNDRVKYSRANVIMHCFVSTGTTSTR
jgi:hypothetical protein